MSISVGIVGVGAFGRGFIKHFQAHPDVSRVALCDLHPDRLAECARQFGITETYSSLDEICKSDIDALAIITQHWLHAPQAVQAMNAGKHVYSAVPAARSLDECDDLVETVRKTGMTYMNGETSYYRPETIFCRKKAAEGAFGQFVLCEAEYFHDMEHGLYEVYERRWGAQWSRDKTGEPPMYYPTHSMCFPVSVMGAHATEVSCQGFIYPNDDWHRADTVSGNLFSNETALFRMSNGAAARICEFRRIGHPGCERASGIYGTEASFEENLAGTVWATKQGSQRLELAHDLSSLPPELAADLGGHGGSHAFLVHEFVDSVNRGRVPAINVWEAVRYCAPGLVAHESALKDGELLKVPHWGDPPA